LGVAVFLKGNTAPRVQNRSVFTYWWWLTLLALLNYFAVVFIGVAPIFLFHGGPFLSFRRGLRHSGFVPLTSGRLIMTVLSLALGILSIYLIIRMADSKKLSSVSLGNFKFKLIILIFNILIMLPITVFFVLPILGIEGQLSDQIIEYILIFVTIPIIVALHEEWFQ